jgi:kynurenine formamidase
VRTPTLLAFLGLWLAATAVARQADRSPASATAEETIAAAARGQGRILDLSHALSEKNPRWPGDTRTFETQVHTRPEEAGYFTRTFWMLEHFGTHMDAPAHFPPGQSTVGRIPPQRLVGPPVVIGVRSRVAAESDYRITAADILAWEEDHGRIPAEAIVLACTGWEARWPDEQRYRNQDEAGVMHFPGFSVEAAKLLIERGVSGLGIDTLSVDYGASRNFEVHGLSHAAELYHLENLANLSRLPASGAVLVVAPIKLEEDSGGPVRVFAILPQ